MHRHRTSIPQAMELPSNFHFDRRVETRAVPPLWIRAGLQSCSIARAAACVGFAWRRAQHDGCRVVAQVFVHPTTGRLGIAAPTNVVCEIWNHARNHYDHPVFEFFCCVRRCRMTRQAVYGRWRVMQLHSDWIDAVRLLLHGRKLQESVAKSPAKRSFDTRVLDRFPILVMDTRWCKRIFQPDRRHSRWHRLFHNRTCSRATNRARQCDKTIAYSKSTKL